MIDRSLSPLAGHPDQSWQCPDKTSSWCPPGTRRSRRDLTSLSKQINLAGVSGDGKAPQQQSLKKRRKWSAPSRPEAWSPSRTPWRRQTRTCTGRAWGSRPGAASPRSSWAAPSSSCPPTPWPRSPWTLGRKSRSKDRDPTETDSRGRTTISLKKQLHEDRHSSLLLFVEHVFNCVRFWTRRKWFQMYCFLSGWWETGNLSGKAECIAWNGAAKSPVDTVEKDKTACDAAILPHGGELGLVSVDVLVPARVLASWGGGRQRARDHFSRPRKPKTDTKGKRFKLGWRRILNTSVCFTLFDDFKRILIWEDFCLFQCSLQITRLVSWFSKDDD